MHLFLSNFRLEEERFYFAAESVALSGCERLSLSVLTVVHNLVLRTVSILSGTV